MKTQIIASIFLVLGIVSAFSQQKEIVKTDQAPMPIGPYSQAVKANGFLFLAGQIGANPSNRKLVEGGIEAETVRVLENIKAVLFAANATLEDVVNTTIYLKDINDFAKMNAIYAKYFTSNYPARATIGVANLPGGANIEMAVVAVLPKRKRK